MPASMLERPSSPSKKIERDSLASHAEPIDQQFPLSRRLHWGPFCFAWTMEGFLLVMGLGIARMGSAMAVLLYLAAPSSYIEKQSSAQLPQPPQNCSSSKLWSTESPEPPNTMPRDQHSPQYACRNQNRKGRNALLEGINHIHPK